MAPYNNTTDTIIASLTDEGRADIARLHLGRVAFKFSGWAVGREGYKDTDPAKVDPLVTSDIALGDHIYPTSPARASFLQFDVPLPNTIAPVCRLLPDEALYGLGELGIWVEVTADTDTPAHIGDKYLFALAHFPLYSKTLLETTVWRVIFAL